MSDPKKSGWSITNSETLFTHPCVRIELTDLKHNTGPSVPDFIIVRLHNHVHTVGLTKKGNLILIKEDRKVGGWSVEAAVGDIEGGETVEQAAAREFNEETDYTAGRIITLGSFILDSNRGALHTPSNHCCSTGHLCVALDLTTSPSEQTEDEIISTIEVPFEEALKCAMDSSLKLPGIGLPILSAGLQNLLMRIRLRPDLRPPL